MMFSIFALCIGLVVLHGATSAGVCIWPSSDPIKKSVGDSVTIKCTYFIRDRQLGNGRFRWSGPAVDDSNSGRVEITDKPQFGKSTLKIHKAKASDNGNYTCLYEETGESASKAVTVRVHPSIKAPTPQYISAGAAGLVMCTINLGNPPVPPENVKWYRNQSQLLSGGRYSYNFSHGLTIESIQPEDSGVYTCLIYTGVGTEREDINVMVQVPNPDKPIRIDGHRVGLLKKLTCGENLHLECFLEDDSESENVTFLWLYPDQNGINVIKTGKTLDVSSPVSPGEYTCTAMNERGRDMHVVNVLSQAAPVPPRIGIDPMIKAHVGEKIEVSCHPDVSSAHPPPQLQWRRTGSDAPLPSDPTKEIYMSNTHSLVIKSVRKEDKGEYSCVASYHCGNVARNISVIVLDEPASHLCIQVPTADCQDNTAMVEELSKKIKESICRDCNVKLANTKLDCSTGQFSAVANIHSDQLELFYSRLNEKFGDSVRQCHTPITTPTSTASPPELFVGPKPAVVAMAVALAVVVAVVVTAVSVAAVCCGLLYCFLRHKTKRGESVSPSDSGSTSSSANFNDDYSLPPSIIDLESGRQTSFIHQPQPSSHDSVEPSLGSQHLQQPQQSQRSTQTHPSVHSELG